MGNVVYSINSQFVDDPKGLLETIQTCPKVKQISVWDPKLEYRGGTCLCNVLVEGTGDVDLLLLNNIDKYVYMSSLKIRPYLTAHKCYDDYGDPYPKLRTECFAIEIPLDCNRKHYGFLKRYRYLAL